MCLITFKKCAYYAQEMLILCSRNVPVMLKQKISLKICAYLLLIFAYYAQDMPILLKIFAYYAQEVCLLSSRNVRIMLKNGELCSTLTNSFLLIIRSNGTYINDGNLRKESRVTLIRMQKCVLYYMCISQWLHDLNKLISNDASTLYVLPIQV